MNIQKIPTSALVVKCARITMYVGGRFSNLRTLPAFITATCAKLALIYMLNAR